MTDQIAARTKLITDQRDEALRKVENLEQEMLHMQNEMAHLRHFKRAIERAYKDLPRVYVKQVTWVSK